jgi:hypothetical protein
MRPPYEKGAPLLLGFDHARWERRKSEAREQWEKERKTAAQTVRSKHEIAIRDAGSSDFMVREPDDIASARRIGQKEINQVVDFYRRLPGLSFEKQVYCLLEIGFHLRCWHDLLPAGRWRQWHKAHLSEIPLPVIDRCLDLWDRNEQVSNTMRDQLGYDWTTPYYKLTT